MKPAFILEVETNFQILVQSTPVISKPDIMRLQSGSLIMEISLL